VIKRRIGITILAVSLLSIFGIARAPAQAQGGGWSKPYRLSSEAGMASEGYLVADQYGYVHCFWKETLFNGQGNVIKYARFDGATWTKPNEIYITKQEVRNVSPLVDQQGMLYIAWAEGQGGSDYYTYLYTYAPANNALSAQNWAPPAQTKLPARTAYMRVDSRGMFHILYINQTEETGVYYIGSDDKGITWSEPIWLDPDILPDHIPDSLNFEIDENDGLHAAWWYGGLNRSKPDWVRYTHSLDGGRTWSDPFMIDQYDEESEHNLTVASPVMTVQGETVHVVWAAGQLPYRYHRFSTDAGQTWSTPVQIFGELHGQAFDGLAVDRAGRVHFVGQIRYPMGIYHAYWDQTRWSKPSPVYIIAEEGSEDDFGDRVHAHFTLPVIRAGNQLVLTFSDPPSDPNRRLFVMYSTLDDLLPLESRPTPAQTATPVPMSSPTPKLPTPMASQTPPAPSTETAKIQPVGRLPAPDHAIQVALVPTLLILGVTIIIQLLSRRKH
jgi:hypothetical protein